MEKRLFLAVVLSGLVLWAYQAYFLPQTPRPRPPQGAPAGPATTTPDAASGTPGATPDAQAPRDQPVEAAATVQDAAERDIVVESDAVHAVFSTRGAVLKSWRLKHYPNTNSQDGTPLDLVPSRAPPGSPRPFTLRTGDAAVDRVLSQALFKPGADAVTVGTGESRLVFEYADASGLTVRKEFVFSADRPYEIDFVPVVTRSGTAMNPTIVWGPALATGIVSSGLTYAPAPQPIFYRDREVTRVGFGDIPEYQSVDGTFLFAGVDDHYFLTAAVPLGQPLNVRYEPVPVPIEGESRGLEFVSWSVAYPAPPAKAKFFLGPKDFDVLERIDSNMVNAIHFGMFQWLVVPLLDALKWIHGYIGNYGWSIIALTALINLVMFPLRHKSVVSMRKMQEIQPEVKAIQDRYAKLKMSDPARQKMNVELMNLYRERGVNPASGCVPMLLTMPVLLAFYAMLTVAIELRGAPFIGWIRDLSAYDPLYITPVLMGATQFVQTKMTPTSADPAQQRMMLIMPVVFTGMLIWAPSGLVLYWTASNMWAIAQQVVTNRLIGPPVQRAVRPPAERRVKAAGGGKTDAAKERKQG
jgi:YidC/Oxa1 family membrane protein insertase